MDVQEELSEVKKEMIIGELMMKRPDLAEVFFRFGIHCVGCGAAFYDTIEQGCAIHGIDADTVVKELNAFLKENPTTN